MRKKLLSFSACSLFALLMSAQAPSIEWQKSYGGSNNETAYAIQPTSDHGFIIAGSAASTDGDLTGNHGIGDYWVVKIDSLGAVEWQKNLGGTQDELANSIQETADGGYIVAGSSASNDGDFSGNHGGGGDFGILKLTSTGAVSWQKSLGGTGYEFASAIHELAGGGYIIGGYADSQDGDVTNTNGGSEFWVVKLDATSAITWQKSYGGSDGEYANDITPTADGGFILAGTASSSNGNVTGAHGGQDAWIVKLDGLGTLEWQKSLGGTGTDRARSVKQLASGGYIVAGFTDSNDGDVSGNNGGLDCWVVRLDGGGSVVWQNALGGTGPDRGSAVTVAADGGYYISGTSGSNDGDVTGNHGGDDIWVAKLDSSGGLVWQKSLGGVDVDGHHASTIAANGDFVLAGYANSNGDDVSGNHGGSDFWVVNLSGTPISVDPLAGNSPFAVFPNPANSSITVQIAPSWAGSTYSITDQMGKQLLAGKLRGESNSIDIASLASGLYFLQIGKHQDQSFKLIKQ